MLFFLKKLWYHFIFLVKKNKTLYGTFQSITGLRPLNLSLYLKATCHSSAALYNQKGVRESYERLEYLGDAILGMIVAEFLYMKYPFEEEGFLTNIRSRIVSRESLGNLAIKIGLNELVVVENHSLTYKSVYGDCLEALIGAVYMDYGFSVCKSFIIQRLIKPHFDFSYLISSIINYKSKLLEWAQKENKALRFETNIKKDKQFTAQVYIENEPYSKGHGSNKKRAEQDAALRTYTQLNLNE